MAATALLKFRDALNTGANGQAFLSEFGQNVVIENSDNTDVLSWRIWLVYAPPGTAREILPGIQPYTLLASNPASSTPTYTLMNLQDGFPGCYRIMLEVFSASNYGGVLDVDIRNIAVLTPQLNYVIPPYQLVPPSLPVPGSGAPTSKPNELNFGGQPYGWAGGKNPAIKMQDEALRDLEGLVRIPSTDGVAAGSGLVIHPARLYAPNKVTQDSTTFWITQWGIPNGSWSVGGWGNGFLRGLTPTGYENFVITEQFNWPVGENGSPPWVFTFKALHDSVNDRMILLKATMPPSYSGWELSLVEFSTGIPAVEGASHATPFTSNDVYWLAEAEIIESDLWIWTNSGSVWKCPLSNLDALTQVAVFSPYMRSGVTYDPGSHYGDGEGRIYFWGNTNSTLYQIKPSDGSITAFSTPITVGAYTLVRGAAAVYDPVRERLWSYAEVSGEGYCAISFGVNPLFDTPRLVAAVDFTVLPTTLSNAVYSSDTDSVIFNGVQTAGSRLGQFQDSGTAITLTGYTDTYVQVPNLPANPTIALLVDQVVVVNQTPSVPGSRPTEVIRTFNVAGFSTSRSFILGPRGIEWGNVAWRSGDLGPLGIGDGDDPARTLVTGLVGHGLENYPLAGGGILRFNVSTGFVAIGVPPPGVEHTRLTGSESVDTDLYNGLNYTVAASGTNYPVSLGAVKTRSGAFNSIDPVIDTQTDFRLWFTGTSALVGQSGGSWVTLTDTVHTVPELPVGSGYIWGLDGYTDAGVASIRAKNAFESLELVWSYDVGTDPYDPSTAERRWVVASRHRHWEHVPATSSTTDVRVGKGIVRVDSSTGAKTVNLPEYADSDDWIIVKDTGGMAGTNPITIQTVDGSTIDGVAGTIGTTIATNKGVVGFRYNGRTTDWEVLSNGGLGGGGGCSPDVHTVSATVGQTSFTLPNTPYEDRVLMIVNGVVQVPSDYVVAGTNVTYSGIPLLAGASVVFYYWTGIGGGGGTDPDALHVNVAAEISGIAEKVTPVVTDFLVIEDSADANAKKRVQIGNLPGGTSTDELVKVSADDTSAGYLEVKLVPGFGVEVEVLDPAGTESLEIGLEPTSGDTKHLTTNSILGSLNITWDGVHLWGIPRYTSGGTGYIRFSPTDGSFLEEVVNYPDGYFTENLVYEATLDRVVAVRLNTATDVRYLEAFSKTVPSVKTTGTNIAGIFTLVKMIAGGGYVWLHLDDGDDGFIYRVPADLSTSVVAVTAASNFDLLAFDNDITRYGDGEGRLFYSVSDDTIGRLKPSTLVTDATFSPISGTGEILCMYVHEAVGRIWCAWVDDGDYYIGVFDCNTLGANLRSDIAVSNTMFNFVLTTYYGVVALCSGMPTQMVRLIDTGAAIDQYTLGYAYCETQPPAPGLLLAVYTDGHTLFPVYDFATSRSLVKCWRGITEDHSPVEVAWEERQDQLVKVDQYDGIGGFLADKLATGSVSFTTIIPDNGMRQLQFNLNQTLAGLDPLAAGDNDDVTPTDWDLAFGVRATSVADAGITGLVALTGSGKILFKKLYNAGSYNLTLRHQNAGSLAANRLIIPGGADLILAPNDVVDLFYDTVSQRWRVG